VRARKEQKQIPHPAKNAGIRDDTLCAARLPSLFFAFDPIRGTLLAQETLRGAPMAARGALKIKKAGDVSRLSELFYQEGIPQLNVTASVLYVCIGLCLSLPRGPHLENLPSVPGALRMGGV
jgi:hypothetical protein